MSDRDALFATDIEDTSPAHATMSRDDLFSNPDSVDSLPDLPSATSHEGMVSRVDKHGNFYYEKPEASKEYEKAGSHVNVGRGLLGTADISLAAMHAVPMGIAHGAADLAQLATRDTSGSWAHGVDRATYQPQTPEGQALFGGVAQSAPVQGAQGAWNAGVNALPEQARGPVRMGGRVIGNIARMLPLVGAWGRAGSAGESATEAAVPQEIQTAQSHLNQQYAGQSMGAAASSPQLSNMSAPLQNAVQAADSRGLALNRTALNRHYDADTLPVPLTLTEGMATGNSVQRANEFNLRGKYQELADRESRLNKGLGENLNAIRDEVGPEVSTTQPHEHAQTVIDAYNDIDQGRVTEIRGAYDALEKATKGKSPLDVHTIMDHADAALGAEDANIFLPKEIATLMQRYRESGSMNFNQYENMRTILARESRKAARAGDGSAQHALGLVRGALEDMPLTAEAQQFKGLADTARGLAKERFDAFRDDPAYDAAVHGSEPPDTFLRTFFTGNSKSATVGQTQRTMRALQGNDTAQQTMGVVALDALRDAARINENYEGDFAQKAYNAYLQKNYPKVAAMLPPAGVENVAKLGRVANYIKAREAAAPFNNSGTSVANQTAQIAGNLASSAAETAVNVHIPGGGSFLKGKFDLAREKSKVKRWLAPGAGINSPE